MTLTAASAYCQWPGCQRRAVTQLRTAQLPWMHVCRPHRATWLDVPYPVLVDTYADMQPARHAALGPSLLLKYVSRLAWHSARTADGKRTHSSRGPS